jgi:hypothetical protein
LISTGNVESRNVMTAMQENKSLPHAINIQQAVCMQEVPASSSKKQSAVLCKEPGEYLLLSETE